jgi:hypothetical protein
MPTSNVTQAVIYRSLEHNLPALIIDEADTFMDNTDGLTGILNSGHKRATAFVHRCVGDDHKVKAFPTFCPMVIARIGELPAALESRSIVIRMQRAKPNEGISRFMSADRAELQKIKARIEKWLLKGEHKKLKDANPTMPATNRLADNWRHLIAIADLARGEWPLARQTIEKLMPKKEEVGGVRLLRAIKQVLDTTSQDKFSSAELCLSLSQLAENDRLWIPQGLASTLKTFNIRPRTMRVAGKTLRGYERSQFVDAFERYLERDADSPEH